MPFQSVKAQATTADPVLVDIDDDGIALMSDGSLIEFPKGTKFEPVPYDAENTKLVMKVTAPKPADGVAVEFKIIKGASKSAVLTAVHRCKQNI